MLTRTRKRPTGLPKQTLGAEIADRLREDIISGRLAPDSVVAEIPTAERLGVSRVPVREATLVLERDGLLVFDERGRCRVRGLSPRDLQEIYEVRLLLECESFRLAAARRTDEQIAQMERNISQMERAKTISRVTLLDVDFHDLAVNAAGNGRLSHLWRIMRGQIQLFTASLQRQVNEVTSRVRENTVLAHRECLSAIVSKDQSRAVDVARHHLELWRERLLANHREGRST